MEQSDMTLKPCLKPKSFLFFVFWLCIAIGIYTSLQLGLITILHAASLLMFGVFGVFYFLVKDQLKYEGKLQLIAILSILIIYGFSWYLIPHISKFGIFFASMYCFLLSGIVLYNSKSYLYKITFLLAFTISAFNLLVIFYFLSEQTLVTKEIITTVFYSNPNETSEYLIARRNAYHLLAFLVFLVLCFFLFFKKLGPISLGFKNGERLELKDAESERLSRKVILFFLFSFFISTLYGPIGAVAKEYYAYIGMKKAFKQTVLDRAKGIGLNFNIISNEGPTKILIMIGESLNRDYMNLYGYPVPNNPLLTRLSQDSSDGVLFKFEDIISPEVTTVEALQKVLTTKNNENNLTIFQATTIVELFNMAGYQTNWMSNDVPLGEYSTPTSVIANSANSLYYNVEYKKDNPVSRKKNKCLMATFLFPLNRKLKILDLGRSKCFLYIFLDLTIYTVPGIRKIMKGSARVMYVWTLT